MDCSRRSNSWAWRWKSGSRGSTRLRWPLFPPCSARRPRASWTLDDYYSYCNNAMTGHSSHGSDGWDGSAPSLPLLNSIIVIMLFDLFDYSPTLPLWQLSYALFAIQFARSRFVSVLQLMLTSHPWATLISPVLIFFGTGWSSADWVNSSNYLLNQANSDSTTPPQSATTIRAHNRTADTRTSARFANLSTHWTGLLFVVVFTSPIIDGCYAGSFIFVVTPTC